MIKLFEDEAVLVSTYNISNNNTIMHIYYPRSILVLTTYGAIALTMRIHCTPTPAHRYLRSSAETYLCALRIHSLYPIYAPKKIPFYGYFWVPLIFIGAINN